MEFFIENLLQGFDAVTQLPVLLCLFAGSLIGIIVGAIPGLGPAAAIAVLLPATFNMEPLAGLSILLGIYCGAWYAGAIPAILINTPGTAVAVLSTYDGYPMTKKGLAKRALTIAFTSSLVGGLISVIALTFSASMLAQVAKNFGAVEFAAATLFGLVLVVIAHKGQMLAAMMMVGIGLFITTIGLGTTSAVPRYTFGVTSLLNGIPLVPVVLGVFAIAQALILLESGHSKDHKDHDTPNIPKPKSESGIDWQGIKSVFKYPKTLLRSSAFGVGIGVLPGVGEFLAQFFSYSSARKASKEPESFGKGNPEGLIASETANNAVTGAALVPLLALGIPGEALTAMMMSVFMVHNVFPGPQLFTTSGDLVYGIYISMMLMNLFIFVALLGMSRWSYLISRIDNRILGILILSLALIGTYSINLDLANVWIALFFGIFGYIGRRLGLPMVPMILGIVLGSILEYRLVQSLTISDGSLMIFLERPIALILILITLTAILFTLFNVFRTKGPTTENEADAESSIKPAPTANISVNKTSAVNKETDITEETVTNEKPVAEATLPEKEKAPPTTTNH